MNGILMIATGSPYYARMAVNLARSIRSFDNMTALQLVTNSLHFFTEEEKDLFTIINETTEKNAFYLKTQLPELSVFDNTIYIDVDMVALNIKIFRDLFGKDIELSIACRGGIDIMDCPETRKDWNEMKHEERTSQWADLKQVIKEYDINEGRWLQLSSEFIQFKKTYKVKQYFEKAKEIYEGMRIHSDIFGGLVPDELALGIACIKENFYPEEKYEPIYWQHAQKRHPKSIDPFINENYYAYSMGGAHASLPQKEFYNNMMVYHHARLGLQPVFFKAQNKSRHVTGREKV